MTEHRSPIGGDRSQDLGVPRSLDLRSADWSSSDETLARLFQRVEAYAMDAREWYSRDGLTKRRASLALTAALIVLGLLGILVPLLTTAGVDAIDPSWGYILLACAAGSLACDRLFGVSTAWMRDLRSAQSINAMLCDFQLEWASVSRAPANSNGEIDRRMGLLRDFSYRVNEVIAHETDSWTGQLQLSAQPRMSRVDRR
ncbi:SLATT domain-containing protein [Nocardia beijingensis]|uniref:SLATT domain-containing protein n=1 Tax=Nocardia beijingensis TaxID=95162 RepID=A0ABW7WA37_9NOCA|nr:SLATT domain-containing protein [Nocardia beijingensis]MBF6078648.1 SLATT domain-containing protein [Nocardia beijingensis]